MQLTGSEVDLYWVVFSPLDDARLIHAACYTDIRCVNLEDAIIRIVPFYEKIKNKESNMNIGFLMARNYCKE